MTNLTEKLERDRKDLLDLTFRNPLLNYRVLRGKGINIIDEMPEEVFRILVLENGKMSFLPHHEKEQKTSGEEGSENSLEIEVAQPEEVISETGLAKRHIDDKLQTSHTTTELQKRLLNTYHFARTYIEEQGVNILYLTLGMLKWHESPNSSQRQSPLLLIPVEIFRTDIKTRFKICFTQEELTINISLQAKLKQDFGITLPELPDNDDLQIENYFSTVAENIELKANWEVDSSTIALGFFSFGKFLMYNDLDEKNWPEGAKPTDHPIIKSLLGNGFKEPKPTIGDDDSIDKYLKPKDINQILSADSSQLQAILDINQGRNLVIQGPPGTGKSQTITNIIAEALAQQKTVLFVAEKMAALEVVKRRLDSVCLGDACLELHSQKSNKKGLLQELQRTLELGQPKNHNNDYDETSLKNKRQMLNDYCEAVNAPISKSNVTPYYAFGKLLDLNDALRNTELPQIDNHLMNNWTGTDFRQRLDQVKGLQRFLDRIGVPKSHFFWGCQLKSMLPEDKRKFRRALQSAGKSTNKLKTLSKDLASVLQLNIPKDRKELENLALLTQKLLDAPNLNGIKFKDKSWLKQAEAIQDALAAGKRISFLRNAGDRWLIREAWEQDVLETRQTLATYGSKWWRFLSSSYRQAQNHLQGLCLNNQWC